MRAYIEPGRREIIGDVAFMTRALAGALERVMPRSAPAASDAWPATLVIQLDLGQGVREVVVPITNEAMAQGRIQVPARALTAAGRVAAG
jgi:hypothetical protein